MTRFRFAILAALVAALLLLPASASAVVGGTPATREYPHMAAMFLEGSFTCGGSLVAPEWVLTAAHCVEGEKPQDVSFFIGGENLNVGEGEERDATQIVVHESFGEPEDLSHDVAVVRLDEPSTKTPIRLADPETERELWEPGDTARVIGYGLPSIDLVGELFQTDVPIVDDQECQDSYDRTIGGFESTTMVCAGQLFGVQDACFGDSGGPLMVPQDGTLDTGTLLQVGVVSWGFLCGVPTQYGVYSRVADTTLYDWIQSRIGNAPPPEPGSIEGTVSERKTGTALSSATVDCESAGSATTGGDGRYSITDVPAATYTCTASKSGYASRSQTVTVPGGGTAIADFELRPTSGKGKGGGKRS